jgi:hypothetical protein
MKTLTLPSLRYLFLASSVSLLPLVALSSKASAQTAGSTTVTANVTGVLQITAPASKSFTVGNSGTAVDIGPVNVRSNQKNGYEVKVYSSNGGKLQNSDKSFNFSYTLSATSGAGTKNTTVTPGTASASAVALYSSLTFQAEKCASSAGCDIGVSLNYQAGLLDTLPVDSYTDTITYEVSAK